MRTRRSFAALATLAMLALGIGGGRAVAGSTQKRAGLGMAGKISVTRDMAALKMAARTRPRDPGVINCTVNSSRNTNVNLDCDDPGYPGNAIFPNNEEHIVVDPTDANHMIASSNDYSSCCDQWYTTFDGGYTWTTGDISKESDLGSGFGSDPVTAIDPKHGTAIHASLNIHVDDVTGAICNPDVVASISTDGGITWDPSGDPVIVYPGSGCEDAGPFVFNDKEWIVTDTNPASTLYGRTYMTWSRFYEIDGVYQESPIWSSFSDDGGYTWSAAKEISGSAPTCTFQTSGLPLECDEDQFSVPTVGPDGTVTVSFQNEQNDATWETGETIENQYFVVQSHNGGITWSPPVHVVDLEDGSTDYPINVDGRQTLTGFQTRVNSAGNVVADPGSGRLYLVFADNRNGSHDVPNPQTNTDVFLMTSTDGTTWAGPYQVTTGLSDEWFPWADVDPLTHKLGIVYHGRDAGNNATYSTYLALTNGNGHYTVKRVSDKTSRARQSLFFRAGEGAPNCHHCAVFIGDYISLDFGPDGSANVSWTDMRRKLTLDGFTGYTENSFFSKLSA
jgi:hypothetical protein